MQDVEPAVSFSWASSPSVSHSFFSHAASMDRNANNIYSFPAKEYEF